MRFRVACPINATTDMKYIAIPTALVAVIVLLGFAHSYVQGTAEAAVTQEAQQRARVDGAFWRKILEHELADAEARLDFLRQHNGASEEIEEVKATIRRLTCEIDNLDRERAGQEPGEC